MVGGNVIGIVRKTDSTLLNVQGAGSERATTRAILVLETSAGDDIEIELGDAVWWQSGFAYWTPRRHANPHFGYHDIRLPLRLNS